jgi:cytochrome P450
VADAMGMIFAGFDTTSNTLAWSLYFLSFNPEARKKLIAEIDGILDDGKSIDDLSSNDIKEAHFLKACVNETLRLRSPAPGHVGDVIDEGTEVDGIKLPKGAVCFTNFSCYYLDELYFDHPDRFDPDRWIDGRVQATAGAGFFCNFCIIYLLLFQLDSLNMSVNELFNPFLPGKHTCIGRVLAELEARVVLAR